MNKKIITHSRLVTLLIFSAVLGACGGDKVVKTVDDSADYKSARALPPLNKNLENSPQEDVVDQAPAVSDTPAHSFVRSELVNVNETTSRLEIELPSEQALDYIADKLVASGLTVHHRNLQAGRISIGCGDIQSVPSTKKKSRWTLGGRKSIGRLDYCALELDSNRSGTVVKVLDLNQQEVDKSAAEKIFQRILVN